MTDNECVFCRIVEGTSECQEIYRDDATLAFMDIHPANAGHCLVIPKRHFQTVFEMPPAAFGQVASTVVKVARAVNEVLQPGGVSLVQANGELAGQTIFHVHVHVLPRRAGDNLLINWDRNRLDGERFDRAQIAETAERLRSRLR
ncbi:MAG: HIT family protein [Alphaproteobacteria bacterium]|nr:HIT family protein [Alphaproteobacteria bacterium]